MTNPPKAGVIGDPISHSLSPKLHTHWLNRYGLAGSYTALKVTSENLETTLRQLPGQGFIGLNVTLPHKVSVLEYADQVTKRAQRIGAANTLTFGPGGYISADNTDGYGFLANLLQGAPDWKPQAGPAAIFGAGGAARAIIVALIDAGIPEIRIANRTRAKAELLADAFGSKVRVTDWAQADELLQDAKTVVNTTSLGMKGAYPFEVPLDYLHADAVVTDIVYSPLRTTLLETAAAKGCRTVDGLGMLLHQGVPGFERWFGKRPTVDDATRAAVLS